MAPAPHLRGVEGQRLAGTALERALWDEQFGPPRVRRSRFDFWISVAEPWWTVDGRLRYAPPADCDLRHQQTAIYGTTHSRVYAWTVSPLGVLQAP